VSVAPDAVSSIVGCSIEDVNHCVGSSSLDFSDGGHGANGSLSNDSVICLLSKGRLSPSNSCMSAHVTPR
jgi:hypothetical protein